MTNKRKLTIEINQRHNMFPLKTGLVFQMLNLEPRQHFISCERLPTIYIHYLFLTISTLVLSKTFNSTQMVIVIVLV